MADEPTPPPEPPPSTAAAATAEPGPAAPDAEVDEELANMKPAAPRRPLGAAVVILLGSLLLVHLRADIMYALSSNRAEDLGDARTVASRNIQLLDNTYVRLSGQPDRRHSLYIEARGAQSRQTFFRLLGTDDRLLVRASDTSTRTQLEDRWAGRLRRVDQVPYAPSLRQYFAEQATARRYLDGPAAKQLLTQNQTATHDRAGRELKVAADAALAIDVVRPDKLRVLLGKDKFAVAEDGLKELARLGTPGELEYPTHDAFTALVDAPAATRNAVIARLDERGLAWQAADLRLDAKRADLAAADALTVKVGRAQASDGTHTPLAAPLVLPWASIGAVSVEEPVRLPFGAFVLTEDESPRTQWYAPALAALLVIFILFNVWYLVRGRRS